MADDTSTAPATDAATVDSAAPATAGQGDVASTVRDALHGNITEQKVTEPIRDAVTKALKAETDKVAAKPADAQVPRPDADGRVRGPDGKFAAKDGAQPTEAKPADVPAKPADAVATPSQAPTAWKKDVAAAHWATLPPEVQAEITKREGDVAKLWEAHQQLKPLAPVMGFANEIAPRLGVNGQTLVQQWAQFQAAIMDPAKKVEAVQWLMKQYGVELPSAAAPAADPAAAASEWEDPKVAALEAKLADFEKWKKGQETQVEQYQREALEAYRGEKHSAFEKFASETGADGQPLRPHLNSVFENGPDGQPTRSVLLEMKPIIEHLKATNPQISDQDALTQAYDAVTWGNPTLRTQMMDQQRQADEAKRLAEHKARAQAASRAAVSPATASPQGPASSAPPKGSVESTVRHAYQQHSAA